MWTEEASDRPPIAPAALKDLAHVSEPPLAFRVTYKIQAPDEDGNFYTVFTGAWQCADPLRFERITSIKESYTTTYLQDY